MPALRPQYDAISSAQPTAFDLACSEKLHAFMAKESPQFGLEEQQRRINILSTITSIFRDWVRSVCLSKHLPVEVANAAGGQIFTSGSYRLGVNEEGMDIDTICVAPMMVTRENFFESLLAILEDHDSVTNLYAIESATVPLITFDFDDVNIDLLFASLPIESVPEDLDINDDSVLRTRTRSRRACTRAPDGGATPAGLSLSLSLSLSLCARVCMCVRVCVGGCVSKLHL